MSRKRPHYEVLRCLADGQQETEVCQQSHEEHGNGSSASCRQLRGSLDAHPLPAELLDDQSSG